MIRLIFVLVPLILCIFCVVDAITSRDDEIRNLPKILWIVLILVFPFVGSIAWLAAGRPRYAQPSRLATEFPEYDRPGRDAISDPVADAEFLRKVRERAEEQRLKAAHQKAEQARLEAERERAKKDLPTDEA
ncbi:PLD nuclease N-terminal domain-containing protein [Nocardioides cavernaquae]|uniref:Cardiolipin synthase N-terminal domain-containing protein n=1 Tax=Nocardioides cavernaquae TaxID=2321396 RepID=A0A3A5H381_9ACTN|nr:PLD nuclease N-terminal domain-containing protein [Nocardioides cavernaquae]RJS45236.1 hypothetical protein D4739_02695 [Nocardioides cavernaquae]